MKRRGALHPFITPFEDSRRWDHVPSRPGDIVISTPPKCGTTWTQRMVMSLLWPADDAPTPSAGLLSPWVDLRANDLEQLAAQLADQDHRRFIKTHTSANGLPLDPDVRYVLVYRDAADALVSWGNHRAEMIEVAVEMLNGLAAADGVDPVPVTFTGDYDELLIEWTAYWSPARHLAEWWPLRHEPNVHVMHYRDMHADLSAEMARLAGFLELEVPDELWVSTVDRCRLESMRNAARAQNMSGLFKGGADAFFFEGGVGRGRRLLGQSQLDTVRSHVATQLPADAATWLASGGPVP